MKPFATLGSEISKVRDRVRRGAEALRPAKVASDVRDQRDRLLAKLGEQTFRLIAERKLQVPKVLQDSVEKLATLLGVQLPTEAPELEIEARASSQPSSESPESPASVAASTPIEEPLDLDEGVDEPSLGDVEEATAPTPPPPPVEPAAKIERPAKTKAPNKKNTTTKKKAAKRRNKR